MIDISGTDKFLQSLDPELWRADMVCRITGSYARGETTETSDIDMVVILDEVSVLDIQKYNAMLDTLSNREQICGFLSGKQELLHWEPSDLSNFITIQSQSKEVLMNYWYCLIRLL